MKPGSGLIPPRCHGWGKLGASRGIQIPCKSIQAGPPLQEGPPPIGARIRILQAVQTGGGRGGDEVALRPTCLRLHAEQDLSCSLVLYRQMPRCWTHRGGRETRGMPRSGGSRERPHTRARPHMRARAISHTPPLVDPIPATFHVQMHASVYILWLIADSI